MKILIVFIFLCIIHVTVYAQEINDPIEVTAAIEKKINQEILKEENELKIELKKDKASEITAAFQIDTFRIEKFMTKYIDYDWSTAGMRTAAYDAATKYDSLLNKYYKQLLSVLKPADKATLIAAQKAWISFRDKELKLIDIIGKDEYSGGGTIQQLIDSDEYLSLIKNRTITIYQHLLRATQSY